MNTAQHTAIRTPRPTARRAPVYVLAAFTAWTAGCYEDRTFDVDVSIGVDSAAGGPAAAAGRWRLNGAAVEKTTAPTTCLTAGEGSAEINLVANENSDTRWSEPWRAALVGDPDSGELAVDTTARSLDGTVLTARLALPSTWSSVAVRLTPPGGTKGAYELTGIEVVPPRGAACIPGIACAGSLCEDPDVAAVCLTNADPQSASTNVYVPATTIPHVRALQSLGTSETVAAVNAAWPTAHPFALSASVASRTGNATVVTSNLSAAPNTVLALTRAGLPPGDGPCGEAIDARDRETLTLSFAPRGACLEATGTTAACDPSPRGGCSSAGAAGCASLASASSLTFRADRNPWEGCSDLIVAPQPSEGGGRIDATCDTSDAASQTWTLTRRPPAAWPSTLTVTHMDTPYAFTFGP